MSEIYRVKLRFITLPYSFLHFSILFLLHFQFLLGYVHGNVILFVYIFLKRLFSHFRTLHSQHSTSPRAFDLVSSIIYKILRELLILVTKCFYYTEIIE